MFKTIFMYCAAIGILVAALVFRFDSTAAFISPISGNETKVILQITNKGAFEPVNAEIFNATGKLVFFRNGVVARDIATVDATANRLVIGDPKTKKELKTVPLDFTASKRIKAYVDLDASFDASAISTWTALKGGWAGLGLSRKIMVVAGTFLVFFFFVLVPLGLVSMAFSIVMDLTHGVIRPFTGSWFNLIIGLGWLFAAWHFGLVDKVLDYPSAYSKIFFAAFIAGYPLYFLADRGFDGDSRAAERAGVNASIWNSARNYTYTKTTWSDGSVTDDKAVTGIGRFIGTVLWFLIFPIFLPFGTFWYLHSRWTLPILSGDFSWAQGAFSGGIGVSEGESDALSGKQDDAPAEDEQKLQ